MTLDTNTGVLGWHIEFSAEALNNGAASVTVAHFHFGARGVSGPPLTPPGNIAGPGTSPLSGSAVVARDEQRALLAGTVYVNIHTTAFPGGEIRGQVVPESVRFQAIQDNTLHEEGNGQLSNGAGQHLFTGRSNDGDLKRALVRFDLSEAPLPVDLTISDAHLILNMSKTRAGARHVSLHRVTRAWGEGTSDAGGNEGRGTSATPGDATWFHARYETDPWDQPGGDFDPIGSAVKTVGGTGKYTWGPTDTFTADVLSWLTEPDANFGWLLLGDETSSSSKRFDSRQHPDPDRRPVLVIAYEPPCPFHVTGDLNGDCRVDLQDLILLIDNWMIDCSELPLHEACVPK